MIYYVIPLLPAVLCGVLAWKRSFRGLWAVIAAAVLVGLGLIVALYTHTPADPPRPEAANMVPDLEGLLMVIGVGLAVWTVLCGFLGLLVAGVLNADARHPGPEAGVAGTA